MDFKTFFKKYFQSGEAENSDNEQFLKTRQPIERSPKEVKQFESWKENQRKHFIKNLEEAFYQQENAGQGTGIRLFLLDTESSKGFICQLNSERYNHSDYQHFFDYLKEKVLHLDYKSYLSDLKIEPSGNHVMEIQRHYLKPRINIQQTEKNLNQQFGNITIEYKTINHEPKEIKFLCQSYSDSKFTNPKDYEKLIEHLLFQ